MYKIKYLDGAKKNLSEIEKFLDNIDRRLTDKILTEIEKRVSELQEMPLRYPKYVDNPDYRNTGVKKYVIFYKVDEVKKIVEIHRILHSAQNIELEMLKSTLTK